MMRASSHVSPASGLSRSSAACGIRRAAARIGAFRREARGSGIVEFSLIVPAMLLIYCALGELATALENSRKVGSYTRAIADLVGRSPVDSAGLQSLFDAASVILQPFDAGKAKIVVSAMGVYKVGGKYYTVVCSSSARNTTPRSRFDFGSAKVNNRLKKEELAPDAYQYEDARYILADVEMPFTPVLGSVFFKWINTKGVITFRESLPWPERTNQEIVLPGGQACPKLT